MATATRKRKAKTIAQYQWKPGSRFSVSADIAGKELDRLAEASGTGRESLTPGQVLDAARDHRSPLHPCFDWDDASAAHAHRLHTARMLIRSVYVVFDKPDGSLAEPVVRYVHVKDPEEGPCYMTSTKVMSNEELHQLALREALVFLKGAQKRWQHLSADLEEIFSAIDRLEDRIG